MLTATQNFGLRRRDGQTVAGQCRASADRALKTGLAVNRRNIPRNEANQRHEPPVTVFVNFICEEGAVPWQIAHNTDIDRVESDSEEADDTHLV